MTVKDIWSRPVFHLVQCLLTKCCVLFDFITVHVLMHQWSRFGYVDKSFFLVRRLCLWWSVFVECEENDNVLAHHVTDYCINVFMPLPPLGGSGGNVFMPFLHACPFCFSTISVVCVHGFSVFFHHTCQQWCDQDTCTKNKTSDPQDQDTEWKSHYLHDQEIVIEKVVL